MEKSQATTIGRIITILLLKQPYYGYVASSLKPEKNHSVPDLEIRCGTTLRLLYNPIWLVETEENRILGKLVHEILHHILLHPARRGSRSAAWWASACDLAVNGHIAPTMLPPASLTVGKINSAFNLELAERRSAEYYYEQLQKVEEQTSLLLRSSDAALKLPGDEECLVQLFSEEESSEINESAARSQLDEITFQAAQEGEIPGNLGEELRGLYRTADINWRNVLKKYIVGKGRIRKKKTMKKISRRFDDQPGDRRTKGYDALIAIDESASMSNSDIVLFYHELRKIQRITKADMKTVRFDTSCSEPVPLKRYIEKETREKQGGTDFRPVFEKARQTGTRLLVIFTDGDGAMPDTTALKTLWVLTGEKEEKMPIGETVRFREGI